MNSFIKTLAFSLPLSYDKEKMTFYDFIQNRFSLYKNELNSIPAPEFNRFLKRANEIQGNATKRRFINLVNDIQCECLGILRDSYKGDIFSACGRLKKLLTRTSSLDNRLRDCLANYFSIDLKSLSSVLYRVRDSKEVVEDCWNIPFNYRYRASLERFNLTGAVCMYLSSSLECCNLEKGLPPAGYIRYAQKFRVKDNIVIPLLDLRVPGDKEIEKMDESDQFRFLLLYPFYCLCLTKTTFTPAEEPGFVEEYLFSQLLFHMLFINKNMYSFFDGIIYTSTTDPSSFNVVLPAKFSVPENNNYNTKSVFIRERLINDGLPFVIFH